MSTATTDSLSGTLKGIEDNDVREATIAEHHAKAAEHIDDAITYCKRLYTNSLISEKTRREYDKMFADLKAKGELAMVRENIGYLMATINAASSYRKDVEKILDESVQQHWISSESRSRWWSKFNDPELLEWERKSWIQTELPSMQKRWKKVAEDKEETLRLAEKEGVTVADVPELSILKSHTQFLSKHYLERKHLADAAHAKVLAHTRGLSVFLQSVEDQLKEATKAANGAYLHPSKVGTWLKRMMKSEDPQKFATSILYPFMHSWKEVKLQFDGIQKKMKGNVPRGFKPASEKTFLLWDYKKRTSYCTLALARMEDVSEQDKLLAGLKLRIRHNLDTEDWKGAEADLEQALKLKDYDYELQSMKQYIRMHKSEENQAGKEEEKSTPQELFRRTHALVQQIPASAQPTYTKMMSRGPSVFFRYLQLVYNRVWLHEVANWDTEKEMQELERVKMGMSQGKGSLIEESSVGTEVMASVVSSHADENAGKVGTNMVANEEWGAWSTIFLDMSYTAQYRIVKNLHHPLKSAVRELYKQGYAYSPTGLIALH